MTLTQSIDETDAEFSEGYRDGRDPDCPEPNENRSARYKHSFAIGRYEITPGSVYPHTNADAARLAADIADQQEKERT